MILAYLLLPVHFTSDGQTIQWYIVATKWQSGLKAFLPNKHSYQTN